MQRDRIAKQPPATNRVPFAASPIRLWCSVFFLCRLVGASALAIDLDLPTDNHALLDGHPEDFYQFVDRDFHGEKTTPWEGGQYGFVRDPHETAAGLIYSHFHEGIDIKPLKRDERGMPLDEVRACADGRVVHASESARASNYGRYVVIEHAWDGCRYYSLYAHLNAISTTVGAHVRKGEKIGVLGFTGVGIDQRRAHVHFELNLMLSEGFEAWHRKFFPAETNRHGLFNGLNLAGLDVARLLVAARKNPALTIPEFLSHEEAAYKVLLPRAAHFDLPKLYPWMLAEKNADAASWEVTFTRSGLPFKIAPGRTAVTEPVLSWVKPSPVSYALLTRGVVTGSGSHYSLSKNGARWMQLLLAPE